MIKRSLKYLGLQYSLYALVFVIMIMIIIVITIIIIINLGSYLLISSMPVWEWKSYW